MGDFLLLRNKQAIVVLSNAKGESFPIDKSEWVDFSHISFS
jgi:hypothetical protein